MSLFLSNNIVDFKNFANTWLTWIILIVLIVLFVAVIVVNLILKSFKHNSIITTKDITYGSICLATAFALSFVGFKMPYGGTLTPASSLPIMIYGYYFGFRKGAIVCVAYTMLQLMQDPYILYPMQVFFDYILPYMSLIFVGIFSYSQSRYHKTILNKKPTISAHIPFFIGTGIYAIARYCSHVLSGAIFFGEYAWNGWAAWPYSIVYNLFALLDAAIAIAAGAGLLSSKAFNTLMATPRNTLQNSDTTAKDNKGA